MRWDTGTRRKDLFESMRWDTGTRMYRKRLLGRLHSWIDFDSRLYAPRLLFTLVVVLALKHFNDLWLYYGVVVHQMP